MTAIVSRGSATSLPFPDDSIPCIVTSPPYNVGVPYDGYDDSRTWYEYHTELVFPAIREMERVLMPGGRLWINVPTNVPTGTDEGERADLSFVWHAAAHEHTELFYRDTIVWNKGRFGGGNHTAWGSWLSPSAPNIRGAYEAVLSFFKGEWKRQPSPTACKQPRVELGGDWTELVSNVWDLQPSNSKYGPAPFPLELPARCIRLSTWPGEVVLDPFGGSGTTAEAADILGRVGISLDISEGQTRATHSRLQDIFGGS